MLSYLGAIWKCRYFWMSLVKMDLRTRYRRSILGMGWSLLHPIAMTSILCIVFHKIFHADVREYAPFLLVGLSCWNYIHTVTSVGCQCLYLGESYIRQYPAPLAIYPLRTALGAIVHFLLAMIVVLVLTWCLKGFGNLPCLVSLVPTFVLLFVFGWSLALLAGFANVYFQDTQHLIDVAFQILFYATPVIYPAEKLLENNLSWLLENNPLVAFLQLLREPILHGRMPTGGTLAVAGVTTLLTLSAASLTLARLQRRLIFHL
jgi:ABC-type polysaccharide/polyol phosphate export permease